MEKTLKFKRKEDLSFFFFKKESSTVVLPNMKYTHRSPRDLVKIQMITQWVWGGA